MPSDKPDKTESSSRRHSSSRHSSSRHSSNRHSSSRSHRSSHRPSSIYAPSRNGSRVFAESKESLGNPEIPTPRSPPAERDQGMRIFGDDSGGGEGGSGMFYMQNTSNRQSVGTLRIPADARSTRSSRSRATGLYSLGGGGSASRFSLTDQFNATRQEYEFDDADDSSIYFTPASEAGFDEEEDPWKDEISYSRFNLGGSPFVAPPAPISEKDSESDSGLEKPEVINSKKAPEVVESSGATIGGELGGSQRGMGRMRGSPLRNAYELFCISRPHEFDNSLVSWDEQVRISFRRLMPLVHPDAQNDDEMQDIANVYFNDIIRSFELLMDPSRRVEYDADLSELSLQGDYDSLLESLNTQSWTGRNDKMVIDEKCQQTAIRQIIHERGIHTASDMTVRLDGRFGPWSHKHSAPRPLDLALGYVVSMPIQMAFFRHQLVKVVTSLPDRAILVRQKLERLMVKHLSGPPNLDPILNISASAHALVENSPLTYLAPLQLAVLSSLSPENVMQVAASGIEPGLSIGLQQEISNQQRGLPPTLLSAEVSLLTMPTKTFAISHAYKFSNMQHPLYLSASATNMLESISTPHVEIEIHQPLPRAQGGGAFWLTMNSGDWGYAVGYPRLCTLFHRLCYIAKERSQPPWGVFTGGFSDILSLVIAMPPQFEVGWTGCKKWTAGARPAVPCRRISTGVYSGCFSHKSRYQATASIGGLVGFGISARYRTGITSHAFQRIRYSRRVGLELELKTSSLMGPQVVGRALARLGKFSHVGLELGSGARGTLYLGFHWQRLGQRISLPVLIAAGEGCGIIAQIAFWGSIAPVIVSAAVNTFKKWRLARMDEIEGKEARKSVREQKKNERGARTYYK